MTSPLKKDGSDFPAKKFVTAEALASYKPVATLVAGQEFSWDLAGTATHNGCVCLAPALPSALLVRSLLIDTFRGSCQVGMRCVAVAHKSTAFFLSLTSFPHAATT